MVAEYDGDYNSPLFMMIKDIALYDNKMTLRERFEEILIVISVSRKIRLAIFFAIAFPLSVNLYGAYTLANFELSGQFIPLEGVIKEAFAKHYDKLGFSTFVGFIALAFKIYPKEKKRIF
jgi:hypothetical protein